MYEYYEWQMRWVRMPAHMRQKHQIPLTQHFEELALHDRVWPAYELGFERNAFATPQPRGGESGWVNAPERAEWALANALSLARRALRHLFVADRIFSADFTNRMTVHSI